MPSFSFNYLRFSYFSYWKINHIEFQKGCKTFQPRASILATTYNPEHCKPCNLQPWTHQQWPFQPWTFQPWTLELWFFSTMNSGLEESRVEVWCWNVLSLVGRRTFQSPMENSQFEKFWFERSWFKSSWFKNSWFERSCFKSSWLKILGLKLGDQNVVEMSCNC